MAFEEITGVCGAFGIGTVLETSVLGGTRNHNYRVRTDRGAWLLRRRYEGYSSREQIAFDHGFAEHAQRIGAPVPAPCRLDDGATYAVLQGGVWEAWPFVEGRQALEGDPGDVRAIGMGLARFHKAGQGYQMRLDKLGARGETDPDVMRGQVSRLRAETPSAGPVLDRYREWMEEAEQALPMKVWVSLPSTVVHGDVQPANILIRDGEVCAFVDLDWCAWRPRLYDLGFALLFCCAKHDTPIDGSDIESLTQTPRWDGAPVGVFLKAYESEASQLERAEWDALGPQLVLSWCHCRIAGALKCAPEARKAFLEREPHEKQAITPPDLPGGRA